MKKTLGLVPVLAASLFAAMCGSDPVGPSEVTGAVWKLKRLEVASTSITVSRPDNYTVEFRDGNQIGVKADCNVCGGAFSLAGGTLQVNTLACTLAYCGTESNDSAFLSILNSGGTVTLNGTELKIESAKGTAILSR